MSTTIYYFSGTGNSLQVAKRLAEGLDAKLVSMAGSMDADPIPSDKVGLVFPTYMYRPPKLVSRFLEKLVPCEYTFLALVNGGDPGGAVERISKILGKRGVSLDAVWPVHMPDNYTPFGGPGSEEKQRELLAKADEVMDEIIPQIKDAVKATYRRKSMFRDLIRPGILYSMGYAMIPKTDSRYWVNENCVGCKSCAKVCPVGNITIENGKPAWNNRCEQCFACLQWCAKEAIEMGKSTPGVPRYRNPNIKRREIIAQSDPTE